VILQRDMQRSGRWRQQGDLTSRHTEPRGTAEGFDPCARGTPALPRTARLRRRGLDADASTAVTARLIVVLTDGNPLLRPTPVTPPLYSTSPEKHSSLSSASC